MAEVKEMKKALDDAPNLTLPSTRAVVKELHTEITSVRKKGHSWESICDLIAEWVDIKPSTLQRYYYETNKDKK